MEQNDACACHSNFDSETVPNSTPSLSASLDRHSKKTRRKVLGRAARRRRKRMLEIQRQSQQDELEHHIEQQLSAGAESETAISSVVPTDRSRIWPSVLERRSISWNKIDEATLRRHLGYIPGNAISIPCRIRDMTDLYHSLASFLMKQKSNEESNVPVVVQLYPLVIRDEYSGGKSGGRKFKARKRQQYMTEQVDHNNEEDLNPVPSGILESDDAFDDDEVNGTEKNQIVTSEDISASVGSEEPEPMLASHAVALGTQTNDKYSELIQQTDDIDENVSFDMTTTILEPFPTIYWLTHPVLRALISVLEVEGFVTKFEKQLASDPAAAECFHNAHLSYRNERYQLITESDHSLIKERRWEETFSRGIAGIRYKEHCKKKKKKNDNEELIDVTTTTNNATFVPAIKCLHTHAAHYLSGCSDNVVGRWVMEQLEQHIMDKKVPVPADLT